MKEETNLKKHLNSCEEYQGPRRSAIVDKQETLAQKIRFQIDIISMDFANGVETSMKAFYKVLENLLFEAEKEENEYKPNARWISVNENKPKQECHICKHCGVETTQSDDEYYAKQETLEEAAASYGNIKHPIPYGYVGPANDFINGAKWQQERMYSEEDMIAFSEWRDKYIDGLFINKHTTKELLQKWFEQFSKLKNG
jgi:hypothetical protein